MKRQEQTVWMTDDESKVILTKHKDGTYTVEGGYRKDTTYLLELKEAIKEATGVRVKTTDVPF